MKTTSICLLFLISCLFLLSVSCGNRNSPESSGHPSENTDPDAGVESDQTGIIKVADQIIYDVEIINPNSNNQWTAECLAGLDHDALVDFVFDGLYKERFFAYDIFEGTPISAKSIRKMEEEGDFSRDRIGKFQFKEVWELDTLNMSYIKKVTEIRMGVQAFQEDGTVANYNPLLRVVL